jgi:hypothetical protein
MPRHQLCDKINGISETSMKGTVSPKLQSIFCDPEMRKKFVIGFSESGHTRNATIDLGNGQNIVVIRSPKIHPSPKNTRRRNIFQLLIGK